MLGPGTKQNVIANYYEGLFLPSDLFVEYLIYLLENRGDSTIVFISQEETEAQ